MKIILVLSIALLCGCGHKSKTLAELQSVAEAECKVVEAVVSDYFQALRDKDLETLKKAAAIDDLHLKISQSLAGNGTEYGESLHTPVRIDCDEIREDRAYVNVEFEVRSEFVEPHRRFTRVVLMNIDGKWKFGGGQGHRIR